MPELSTVPSAIRPLDAPSAPHRTRALDVGAGVGRVTADVLLHLVSDVVLVEPVETLVKEALSRGRTSESTTLKADAAFVPWKGIASKAKSVFFIQDTLQGIDPCRPSTSSSLLDRVGYVPPQNDLDEPFDIIWCQWCLGSLSDVDLVAFLRRSRGSLRDPKRSLIIVKENCCHDDNGQPTSVFDDTDSSITRYDAWCQKCQPVAHVRTMRSDLAWKKAFAEAGLTLVHQQLQRGFPDGLYAVNMYAILPWLLLCSYVPSLDRYALR